MFLHAQYIHVNTSMVRDVSSLALIERDGQIEAVYVLDTSSVFVQKATHIYLCNAFFAATRVIQLTY